MNMTTTNPNNGHRYQTYGTLPTEHRFDMRLLSHFVEAELDNTETAEWLVRTQTCSRGTKMIVQTPRGHYGPRVCIRECGGVKIARVTSDPADEQMEPLLFHLAAALMSYWRSEVVDDADGEEPNFLNIMNFNMVLQ